MAIAPANVYETGGFAMKVWVLTAALVLTPCAMSFAAAPGRAPVAIVVVDGIQGDSRVKPGAIDVSSISPFDCSAPGSAAAAQAPAAAGQKSTHAVTSPRDAATGQASGKRQHKSITFTKELDKSSPLLAKAAAAGTPIPRARMEQGGVTYELEGILIGMLKQSGAGDRPMETLTLNFTKCTRR